MDYNYVRMRNAASRKDAVLAEKYRKLYEKRKSGKENVNILNLTIIIMLIIAFGLGLYIILTNGKQSLSAQEAVKPTEAGWVEPDIVTQPENGVDNISNAAESGE